MEYGLNKRFKKTLAASYIAFGLSALVVQKVQAVNFEVSGFDVSFDSTFTLGSSWRVENRKWSEQIGKSNNLNNGFDFSNYKPYSPYNTPSSADVWQGEGAYSTNGDNGNLNFDSGKAFSKIFKGTHDLDIRYDNVGFFVRGMYYYDFAMMDDDRAWSPLSFPGAQSTVIDPCQDDEAKEYSCSDIRLLDAFFYGDFDIGDTPVSVRLGQQVISWGESTLISHGISELNPVDIARLRAPGAELKEAFIPFGALWTSIGLSENINVEMFYQYSFEKTVLPTPGSYFSTNDFAGAGGHESNVQLGFAGNPDLNLDFLIAGLNEVSRMFSDPTVSEDEIYQQYLAYPTKLTLRAPGKRAVVEPEDGGQYGIRLSWYLPQLNDTELSFYHMNYHSRRPVFSGITADFTDSTVKSDLAFLSNNVITKDNYDQLNSFSKVLIEYPEDIKLYAVSFNTAIGTSSVAGEMTYRQDEPLQIDDVELLFAAMPQQLANSGVNDSVIRPDLAGISQMGPFDPGEQTNGYILSDTLQLQTTLTHLFGPRLGASQLTGLIEIGGVNINDMPAHSEMRLNGPGTARNGGISGKEGLELGIQNGVETNPFPTEFSWGYRLVSKLDYNNVLYGINMSPRVVFLMT